MTISIDASTLLSYYQIKAGITPTTSSTTATSGASTSATTSTNPTAPWTKTPTAQQTNALVESVLSGQSIINPNAVKLSTPNASSNYKNLFALYQGLTALQDLANQAGGTGETSGQLAQLQQAFSNGLGQVQTYLNSTPFRGFQVAQGSVAASVQATAGVQTETDTYTTGMLWNGSASAPVTAFQGNVQFAMTVSLPGGTQKVINFDLSQMGSTPRTMSNVVSYLNSQLSAAGVSTTFSDVRTAGKPQTVTVNGQTYTEPAGPDQFSLQINGNSVEQISFSAPTSAPAVYLTQSVGAASTTSTSSTTSSTSSSSTPSDVSQQLVGLTTDPTASSDQIFSDTLGSEVQNAIATATAPDGSVYVLANINGSTQAGETDSAQTITGSQDVALMKYDSAGNLVYTRTLGATGSASGLSLAVSSDGSQVAVVGSATGLVTGAGQASSNSVSSGFVAVYDDQGQQQWTQTLQNGSSGQASQVAFGADGSVYVAGTTALGGSGLSDGYLAGFTSTGVQTFSTSLGLTSQNNVTGIAVDGSSIITAGVQNGDAVVQSYALQPSGSPTLTATRDLGALQGGNVAGVAVNADGSVIVAGSTHNGALNAGTITNAYASGEEAFVAQLSSTLAPSGSDSLTYYAGTGDTRATALTVVNGQAYIAGQVAVTPQAGQTTGFDGFAAQIDLTSGAVGWSDQYSGADGQVAPTSIAVGASGSSALNQLGLPTGAIDFAPSQNITANSSVQAGEQFKIKTNYMGVAQTITVAAGDTLQTLAQKINQATGFETNAQVVTTNGVQKLQITPNFQGVSVTLEAGPSGANALPALGLSEGVVVDNATAKAKSTSNGQPATNSLKANYALSLPSTLNLTTASGVAAAKSSLANAISTVKQIYTDMTTAPSTTASHGSTGAAPAYLTTEIANYQAALERLQSAAASS
jgi:hypothetical protein